MKKFLFARETPEFTEKHLFPPNLNNLVLRYIFQRQILCFIDIYISNIQILVLIFHFECHMYALQTPTLQATGFYFRRSRSGNYNQNLWALRSSEKSKRSESKADFSNLHGYSSIEWRAVKN